MLGVAGEQAGGETLLDRVVDLDGMLERLDLHGVENRDKDLVLDNVSIGADAGDGRGDKVTGALEDVASGEDLAALGLDSLDTLLVVLDSSLGVKGAAEGAGLERIADADRLVGLGQLLDELVMDLLVQQEAASGGATLTGSADGGKENGAESQVEISVVHDNNGVVTAELEERLAEALGNSLADLAANGGGTSEGEEADTVVFDHGLTDIGATSDQGAEGTGEAVLDKDLLEDLGHGDRGQVGGWGALPDNGVTADESDGRVPA